MKLLSSIKDIKCEAFWNICVSEDADRLGGLIIEGTPTDEELLAAWNNITLEYAELMSPETRRSKREALKLERLKFRAVNATTALHILRSALPYKTTPEEEADLQQICDDLTRLFPAMKLDYIQRERLIPLFDKIEGFIKKWVFDINQMLGTKTKQIETNVRAKYEDYQNMLSSVILFHKLQHVSANQITVLEFALYYKRMTEQIDAQKK